MGWVEHEAVRAAYEVFERSMQRRGSRRGEGARQGKLRRLLGAWAARLGRGAPERTAAEAACPE